MVAYTLKRVVVAFLILLVVSGLTFSLSHLSADPALTIAGEQASDEDIEAVRKLYGFDKPVIEQYVNWLSRALRGDFGKSYHYKAPVVEMISGRIGTTMTLGFLAIVFALVISIPLGTLAGDAPQLDYRQVCPFDSCIWSSTTNILVRLNDDNFVWRLV